HSWSHSFQLCSGTGTYPLQQGASPDRRRSIEETYHYVKQQLVETFPILWPADCPHPACPPIASKTTKSPQRLYFQLVEAGPREGWCHPKRREGSAFQSSILPRRRST